MLPMWRSNDGWLIFSNSLWHSGASWRIRSWWLLVQIRVCRLTIAKPLPEPMATYLHQATYALLLHLMDCAWSALNHYLNLCWHIVHQTIRNIYPWNVIKSKCCSQIGSIILHRPQCHGDNASVLEITHTCTWNWPDIIWHRVTNKIRCLTQQQIDMSLCEI